MSAKLKPLTNRSASDGRFVMPADGWFMICPIGEFPHDESGLTQVIDQAAVEAMANAFTPGNELLIDFDHESHDPEKPTRAAGWMQNLVARGDGLYGQVKWSAGGLAAVKGGEYRFISPVWLAPDCEQLGNNKVRPLRLYDAGLTNKPNLQGITALSNRREVDNPSPPAASDSETVSFESDFDSIVRNFQTTNNCSFSIAYDRCKSSHLQEYKRLLNRAASLNPSTGFARAIRNDAPWETEKMQPSQCPSYDVFARFDNHVKKISAERGITYEKAFDRAKSEHPNDYAQLVHTHNKHAETIRTL